MARADPAIRIRMYNVGFGDAFLLFLPTDEGERTVLVDCGVHPNGVTNAISTVAKDIVAAVTTNGRARLDVVVATHRHADHISGFALKLWRNVDVGEVWMPWTEDPSSPAARHIREAQHRLALAIAARARNSQSPAGWLALNSLSNADAERTLLRGFAGKPRRRFLPARLRTDRSFRTDVLPGIIGHALGPSHDEKVVATLLPPKSAAFPLRGAAGTGRVPLGESDDPPSLFASRFQLSAREYSNRYARLAAHADADAVRSLLETDLLLAASGLEDAINGTSLMLVLEVDERCLLLGGDAEWGTWSEVLADEEWSNLLAHTSVYKVSHHGSYNGTPKPFVDTLLPSDALSLVSLRPMERWPSIPRASLLTALGANARRVIRTDQLPTPDATITRNGDLWIEVTVPV